MTTTEALFTIGGGLACSNIGFLVWWGKRITDRVDALITQREACGRTFADKVENTASHTRIWKAVEGLEKLVHDHETRMCTVEDRLGRRGE